MDTNKQENNFDSSNLIVFILRKWKPILAVTAFGAILAIIASLVITPKFKSTVIMFPATSGSISKGLLTTANNTKDLMVFGEEEEVEQMMQILLSDEIRNRVVKNFNLYQHYDIDPEGDYPRTKLQKEYNNNVSIERTQFMSIQIEVLDKDPIIAAKMANDIAALVDTVMNNMKHERALEALQIIEKEYNYLDSLVNVLELQFKEIRKKGINNYESQSRVYNDAYAVAITEGRMKGARLLEKKLNVLSEYGGVYVKLRDRLYMANKRFGEVREKLELARVDAKQSLPHTFVVEQAQIAEKKSYPVRWLIVVVSTFGAFILSILLMLIIDTYKKQAKA